MTRWAAVALGGKPDGYGYGNVGVGLEYRFTDHIGIFVDGR